MKSILAPVLIAGLLGTLTACTSISGEPDTAANPEIRPETSHDTMTTIISTRDFVATESALRAAIASRDLTLFVVIDHGAGARSVDMNIGESKLFVFGNPRAGTPLMIADRRMGLELPLKVLLHTTVDGTVHLDHDDITALAGEYALDGQIARLETIQGNLHAIIRDAAGL